MKARERFFFLVLIMVVVCMTIIATMIIVLYRHQIQEHREMLGVSAQSQARLIESVARHEIKQNSLLLEIRPEYDPFQEAINLIAEAHENYIGFGETGEFTLARADDNFIVFVLRHRHDTVEQPAPVAFDSELAEPMRLALKGQSGSIIGLDYRGKTVLAAYEPVAVLNLGIVAKIDLAEIRAPFIKSGLLATSIALVVILTGTTLFFRVGSPIIKRLETYSRDLEKEISGHKKSVKALQESEERFRLVFESNPDPVAIARVDNDVAIDVNNAFEAWFGIERDKVIGHSSDTLGLWTDKSMRESFLDRLQHAGEINKFETELRLRNGETRSVLLSARLLNIHNEFCNLIVLHDITTEKVAELALKKMDQEKNEFISMAAHELRTPLSAMMGYTELLLTPEKFGGFSEEQKLDFLHEVYDRGESLTRIIDDLLDVSRIENGYSVTLDLQQDDFKTLLRKTVEFYRSPDSEHRFRLDLLDEADQPLMLIDRHRIKQVIENLLANAVKYSPGAGEITVIGRPIADGWEVKVKDQGIGMTPDQIDRIFDKFYRVDSSDTSTQGLGLGMGIVKQIIEAHGGSILVESVKGQGSVVTCSLPCAFSDQS